MTTVTNEILLQVSGATYVANTATNRFFTQQGKEVIVERILNKCRVKLANKQGTLRMAKFNGCKYAILPDNSIISLSASTAGKQVFADPSHGAHRSILETCKSQVR